ncbi:hypothetical protein Pelo_19663 [Pelomyxa schiedti]|nr:hypothetical protein Pelo_19663 [Pelomyxa schiedti]
MSTGRVSKWIAEFENNIRSRQLSDAEAVSEFRLAMDGPANRRLQEEAIRIAGEGTQQGNRANAFITQGELEEEAQDGEYEKRGKRAACWTPAQQQEGRDKKPRTTGQERRESEIREKMEAIEGIIDRLAEQLDKQKAKAEEQRILLTNAQ